MRVLKVSEHPDLIRDVETQAILQTDLSVVHKHEKRIREFQNNFIREQEINSIRCELEEVKKMLADFLKGNR